MNFLYFSVEKNLKTTIYLFLKLKNTIWERKFKLMLC